MSESTPTYPEPSGDQPEAEPRTYPEPQADPAADVPDADSPQEAVHDTPHDDDTPGPGKGKRGDG